MNKEHILLVEDDEVFSRVMTRALLHRNYEVSHAATEEEALQLIKSTQYNYAILDLNLGGHTSLGLIAPLKQSNPASRILILSALLLNTDKSNATAHPEATHLEPMSVRRLEWEHIQKVLNEHDGNISETARQLKMHRRTLQRKLQKRPVAK